MQAMQCKKGRLGKTRPLQAKSSDYESAEPTPGTCSADDDVNRDSEEIRTRQQLDEWIWVPRWNS